MLRPATLNSSMSKCGTSAASSSAASSSSTAAATASSARRGVAPAASRGVWIGVCPCALARVAAAIASDS